MRGKERIEVYEGIEKVTEKVKGDDNFIILGNWNSKVGKEMLGHITGNYELGIKTKEETN